MWDHHRENSVSVDWRRGDGPGARPQQHRLLDPLRPRPPLAGSSPPTTSPSPPAGGRRRQHDVRSAAPRSPLHPPIDRIRGLRLRVQDGLRRAASSAAARTMMRVRFRAWAGPPGNQLREADLMVGRSAVWVLGPVQSRYGCCRREDLLVVDSGGGRSGVQRRATDTDGPRHQQEPAEPGEPAATAARAMTAAVRPWDWWLRFENSFNGDVVSSPVCIDGTWTCPTTTVPATECPSQCGPLPVRVQLQSVERRCHLHVRRGDRSVRRRGTRAPGQDSSNTSAYVSECGSDTGQPPICAGGTWHCPRSTVDVRSCPVQYSSARRRPDAGATQKTAL